jgi:hypothetical protein
MLPLSGPELRSLDLPAFIQCLYRLCKILFYTHNEILHIPENIYSLVHVIFFRTETFKREMRFSKLGGRSLHLQYVEFYTKSGGTTLFPTYQRARVTFQKIIIFKPFRHFKRHLDKQLFAENGEMLLLQLTVHTKRSISPSQF